MPSDLKFKPAFLFGLIIFLVIVIAEAPSTLLSSKLVELSHQHLGLSKERGTIWRGDADLVALSENQQLTLGHLKWQIHAQSLLNKFVTISLVWNGNAPIQLLVTKDGFKVSKLNIDLPASVVTYYQPSLNIARLDGVISITSDEFSLQNGVFNGALNILWLKASSGICNINPLGNYSLNIEGKQQLLALRLSTLDGELNLQGDGYLSMQSGLTFNGVAKANKQQEAMAPLLHVIGNERASESGLFQFNF